MIEIKSIVFSGHWIASKRKPQKVLFEKKILQFGNVIASWTLSLYC
jgi:hypothetical protein